MAEETTGIDLSNINLNNIKTLNEMLSDAASGQPSSAAVEAKNNYYSISDDPSAPLVEIPKNLSPEEVDAYLASDELQAQIFNQGFLYIPGTAARKIEAPTMDRLI